jgi:hypothetical protein
MLGYGRTLGETSARSTTSSGTVFGVVGTTEPPIPRPAYKHGPCRPHHLDVPLRPASSRRRVVPTLHVGLAPLQLSRPSNRWVGLARARERPRRSRSARQTHRLVGERRCARLSSVGSLRTSEWALLGAGLATGPLGLALVVLSWFVVMRHRRDGPIQHPVARNLARIGLAPRTIVSLGALPRPRVATAQRVPTPRTGPRGVRVC